jgi:hypothetical protein
MGARLLVVRPLGQVVLINCASPTYLREYGIPTHPDDLADGHRAVGYTSSFTQRELPWERSGGKYVGWERLLGSADLIAMTLQESNGRTYCLLLRGFNASPQGQFCNAALSNTGNFSVNAARTKANGPRLQTSYNLPFAAVAFCNEGICDLYT